MFVAPNYRQHFHVDLDWDNVSDLILKETTIRCALVLLSKAQHLVHFVFPGYGLRRLATLIPPLSN